LICDDLKYFRRDASWCTAGAMENFESRFCQFSADEAAFRFWLVGRDPKIIFKPMCHITRRNQVQG
jgi:hypothetical protein